MKRFGMIGLICVGFIAGILPINTYSVGVSIARAEIAVNTFEEDALKFANMFLTDEAFHTMLELTIENFKAIAPADTPEKVWERMKSASKKEDFQRMVTVPLYMDWFTHHEIKEIIEIYTSPVMQKFIIIQPQLMQEGAKRGMEWGRWMAEQIKEQ